MAGEDESALLALLSGRIAEIEPTSLTPIIKKAADDFYCTVLETAEDYLRDNLDWNIRSHISMLRRENQRMRTELWEVDRTLGCLSMGHETRLKAIKELEARHNEATGECWRLRGVIAEQLEGLAELKAMLASDTDGTATAAINEDLSVPKDCQAGAESIAQKGSSNGI